MDRLTPEQAALVFRRAAELEGRSGAASSSEALDVAAVEQAGREAGLPVEAVQQGIAELRAEGLPGSPGASVRATDVVVTRTVDTPLSAAARAVVDFLTGELFQPSQDLGDRTVWVPERGIEATVERHVEGVGLQRVTRIVAALVEVPGPTARTLVRLEADVRVPFAGARAGGPVAAGLVAGGAAATVEPVLGAAVAAGGVVVGVLGWRSARAARRRAVEDVRGVLGGFLDWLT